MPLLRTTLELTDRRGAAILMVSSELPEILDFYKCYRAYVRGKIACFTSTDPALEAPAQRAQRNLARHYFGLAYEYAGGTSRSSMVVLYGLMGSGKTNIARYLRERDIMVTVRRSRGKEQQGRQRQVGASLRHGLLRE